VKKQISCKVETVTVTRDASYYNASLKFEPITYREAEIEEAFLKIKQAHRYEDFLDILRQYLVDFKKGPQKSVFATYLTKNPQAVFLMTELLMDYLVRCVDFHTQYAQNGENVIGRVFRRFSSKLIDVYCETTTLWVEMASQAKAFHPYLDLVDVQQLMAQSVSQFLGKFNDCQSKHFSSKTAEQLEALCSSVKQIKVEPTDALDRVVKVFGVPSKFVTKKLTDEFKNASLESLHKDSTLWAFKTVGQLDPEKQAWGEVLLCMHVRKRALSSEVRALKKECSGELGVEVLVSACLLKSEESMQSIEKWVHAEVLKKQDDVNLDLLDKALQVVRLGPFLKYIYSDKVTVAVKHKLLNTAVKRFYIDSAYLELMKQAKDPQSFLEKFAKLVPQVQQETKDTQFFPPAFLVSECEQTEAPSSYVKKLRLLADTFVGMSFTERLLKIHESKDHRLSYYVFNMCNPRYQYQGTRPPSYERFEGIVENTVKALDKVGASALKDLQKSLATYNPKGAATFCEQLAKRDNLFQDTAVVWVNPALNLKKSLSSKAMDFKQCWQGLFALLQLGVALNLFENGLKMSGSEGTLSTSHLESIKSAMALAQDRFSKETKTVITEDICILNDVRMVLWATFKVILKETDTQKREKLLEVWGAMPIFEKDTLKPSADFLRFVNDLKQKAPIELKKNFEWGSTAKMCQNQLSKLNNKGEILQKCGKLDTGLEAIELQTLVAKKITLSDCTTFFKGTFKTIVELGQSEDFKNYRKILLEAFESESVNAFKVFEQCFTLYAELQSCDTTLGLEYIDPKHLEESSRFADGAHCCNTSDPGLWAREGHVGEGMYPQEIHRWLADPMTLFFQVIQPSLVSGEKPLQVGWLKVGLALDEKGSPGVMSNLLYLTYDYHNSKKMHAALWGEVERLFFSHGFQWIAQADPVHRPSNTITSGPDYVFEPKFVFTRLQGLEDEKDLKTGGLREIKMDRSYPGNKQVVTGCFLKRAKI